MRLKSITQKRESLILKLVYLRSTSVNKLNKETRAYMNVIMSMLQNADIQQKIMAWWPPTSDVLIWVSVLDVITVLRDHGQAIHG